MYYCARCYSVFGEDGRPCACEQHAALTVDALEAPVVILPERHSPQHHAGLWNTVRSATVGLALLLGAVTMVEGLLPEPSVAEAYSSPTDRGRELRELRRTELIQALAALDQLQIELSGRRYSGTASPPWERGWRGRLRSAQASYRLDGQAKSARSFEEAEAALHDVSLYLTSLEARRNEPWNSQTTRQLRGLLESRLKRARVALLEG